MASVQNSSGTMRAMLLDRPGSVLRLARIPIPFPSDFEILVRVTACGVCRTDLHIADGELAPHRSPLILGHEVVGTVVHVGPLAHQFAIGYRAYAMTGGAQRLGLYGFGAAAHIIAQVARHQGKQVFAFTRPGEAFFALAKDIPIRTSPVSFALEHANEALAALRNGAFDGAAVLLPVT